MMCTVTKVEGPSTYVDRAEDKIDLSVKILPPELWPDIIGIPNDC